MLPVTGFAKQYIKLINLNGKSTDPIVKSKCLLFISQAQAEFINDSYSDQETTSKIFQFIYSDQCRPREKQFP